MIESLTTGGVERLLTEADYQMADLTRTAA